MKTSLTNYLNHLLEENTACLSKYAETPLSEASRADVDEFMALDGEAKEILRDLAFVEEASEDTLQAIITEAITTARCQAETSRTDEYAAAYKES